MEKGSRSTRPQPSCYRSSAHVPLQSSTPPSRLLAESSTSTISGTDWLWSQPTGWLGIAYSSDRLLRTYALVFGLGAGLIADEVGLLLTFGDYQSELTSDF